MVRTFESCRRTGAGSGSPAAIPPQSPENCECGLHTSSDARKERQSSSRRRGGGGAPAASSMATPASPGKSSSRSASRPMKMSGSAAAAPLSPWPSSSSDESSGAPAGWRPPPSDRRPDAGVSPPHAGPPPGAAAPSLPLAALAAGEGGAPFLAAFAGARSSHCAASALTTSAATTATSRATTAIDEGAGAGGADISDADIDAHSCEAPRACASAFATPRESTASRPRTSSIALMIPSIAPPTARSISGADALPVRIPPAPAPSRRGGGTRTTTRGEKTNLLTPRVPATRPPASAKKRAAGRRARTRTRRNDEDSL